MICCSSNQALEWGKKVKAWIHLPLYQGVGDVLVWGKGFGIIWAP